MKTTNYNALIEYNPDTGRLIYTDTGLDATTVVKSNNREYLRVTVRGITYAGHKLAWMLVTGEEPASDTRIRFIDGDPLNIKANNLTYGHGKLSNRLLKPRYLIRNTQEIVYKYEVVSIRGDQITWLNKFLSIAEAQAYIDELNKPPFKTTLSITDKLVKGVIEGEAVEYTSKNKAESIAIAQALLLGL